MLTINNLKLFNFIKYKEQEIPLKDMGLILLKGDNRDEPIKASNASGKTLIMDAILWLISGSPTRKIRSNRVIGKHGKYAFVNAEIESNGVKYDVTRYRNHPKYRNSLRIIYGDDISHRRVDETEERLEQVLGCSFNLFRLSCFQDSNPKYHFSRMDSMTRGKVLDEICKASEANVPERLKKIKELIKESEKLISNLETEREKKNNEIENIKSQVLTSSNLLKTEEDNYKNNVESQKQDIRELVSDTNDGELKSEFNSIERELISIAMDDREIKELDIKIKSLSESKVVNISCIKNLENDTDKIRNSTKSEYNAMCEYCGNQVTDESLNGLNIKREKEILKIDVEIKVIIEETKKIGDTIEKLNKKNDSLKSVANKKFALVKKKGVIEYEIDKLAENKKKIEKKKTDLKNYVSEFNKHISNIRDSVAFNKTKIVDLKDNLNTNYIKMFKIKGKLNLFEILHDFYSPAGFRPLIMSHYSPVLSKSANYFINSFSNTQRINISSKTELASGDMRDKIDIQVIENKEKKSFPDEFSKGEGNSIDISMNLGVMKLASMKAAKSFGFMYLDECMDGLSSSMANQLIKVIKEKLLKEGMTIIITSHRSISEDNFDYVWTAVKHRDVCKIER